MQSPKPSEKACCIIFSSEFPAGAPELPVHRLFDFRKPRLTSGESLGIAPSDDDFCAVGAQKLGGGKADPGSSASDENSFILHKSESIDG